MSVFINKNVYTFYTQNDLGDRFCFNNQKDLATGSLTFVDNAEIMKTNALCQSPSI